MWRGRTSGTAYGYVLTKGVHAVMKVRLRYNVATSSDAQVVTLRNFRAHISQFVTVYCLSK